MRKRRVTTEITRGQFIVMLVCLVVFMGVFLSGVLKEDTKDPVEIVEVTEDLETWITEQESVICTSTPIYEEESTEVDPLKQEHDDNYIYPFNIMSADWGSEVYESGFRYYRIPQEYKDAGGCFPEIVQVYLWCMCEEYGVDYYTVLALIERESGYKWDKAGDNGNSKGYMQIYEKWHEDRMEQEGVTDLYLPYGNIRVGLNYLQEIQNKYLSSSGEHCVLMVYNMGESGAKRLWSKGIYSSEYSREILQRAQELRQELQE